jgi:glycosyltransferase involved in cell wall biosynthesis
VTTDVCGAREAIDSAEAGRVVSNDPITIAEAVSELLNDPPDPERVARGGRKFDWERNSRELRDHLEEAVVRYRSRRRLPDETS